ncbi:unnamed protein product, partial [Durusdinium trenchii]
RVVFEGAKELSARSLSGGRPPGDQSASTRIPGQCDLSPDLLSAVAELCLLLVHHCLEQRRADVCGFRAALLGGRRDAFSQHLAHTQPLTDVDRRAFGVPGAVAGLAAGHQSLRGQGDGPGRGPRALLYVRAGLQADPAGWRARSGLWVGSEAGGSAMDPEAVVFPLGTRRLLMPGAFGVPL